MTIIHMMHFPWDRDQKLKENDEDFDHQPYFAMQKYAAGFDVRLWTYSRARSFCQEFYPDIWDALLKVTRPVMLIDVLRWVVVHHFGGLYWQMNTTPLKPMTAYFPSPGHAVRLFTEFDLTADQCQIAKSEPIRQGEPEESKRVLIQVFSALPGAAFVKNVIQLQLERIKSYRPKKDYDILFITGNAAISTAYDRYGKNDKSVELTGLAESRHMIKWHYRGSWRMDNKTTVEKTTTSISSMPYARGLSRIPMLASMYYRYVARHPHEVLVAVGSRYNYRSLRIFFDLLSY